MYSPGSPVEELACDFPLDVAQALLPAGADILVGAGERRSPGQAKAELKHVLHRTHRLYNPELPRWRGERREEPDF